MTALKNLFRITVITLYFYIVSVICRYAVGWIISLLEEYLPGSLVGLMSRETYEFIFSLAILALLSFPFFRSLGTYDVRHAAYSSKSAVIYFCSFAAVSLTINCMISFHEIFCFPVIAMTSVIYPSYRLLSDPVGFGEYFLSSIFIIFSYGLYSFWAYTGGMRNYMREMTNHDREQEKMKEKSEIWKM